MTRIVVLTSFVLALGAVDARAQMTMGSFKGYLTVDTGAISGGDLTDARLNVGASVAVHEESGWGAEFDVGHATDARSGRQVLDITTYMVNAAWMKSSGIIRPFGAAGAGVMQINGCNAPCNRPARTYDFGVSAGGGAFAAITDVIGVRGDVRYFFSSADHQDLQRPSGFGFWRTSIGVTLMWATVP